MHLFLLGLCIRPNIPGLLEQVIQPIPLLLRREICNFSAQVLPQTLQGGMFGRVSFNLISRTGLAFSPLPSVQVFSVIS